MFLRLEKLYTLRKHLLGEETLSECTKPTFSGQLCLGVGEVSLELQNGFGGGLYLIYEEKGLKDALLS